MRVGVMNNTINSRYGPQLPVQADRMSLGVAVTDTGRRKSRDAINEVVESDIAKVFTLNCDGEAWARHGAQHPLGSDFAGSQDLIPQLIDEQSALGYAAKFPRSLVEELFAVETPDEVIEQIAEFRDQGMRHVVVGNAGAIQPSLRKSAATTAPYVKVVRGLRKL